jgi:nucleotide-binding universal stress UspA family protein
MFKTILFPLNRSPETRQAVDVAINLVQTYQSTIYLFAVVDPEAPESDLQSSQVLISEIESHFAAACISAKSQITEGKAAFVICDYADEINADLIVMGSHGTGGLKEAFLGSNTQRVLRTVSTPVLVIKNEIPVDFKKIVFAATFKEDVHKAFAKILNFAKVYGSDVHLLYVNMPYNFEDSTSSNQRMHEFAAQYPNHQFKQHIFNAFDEESGIIKFSKTNGIDLIATTTHGKSGFMQMLSPSITESLANHSSLPVLSVNLK